MQPNDYNPNRVAAPELELLKISIISAGWTQPIVINPDMEIIDGFHRWTVSGHKEMIEIYGEQVPTVMTVPADKSEQQMHTIRHNRARGTHLVLEMSKIVQDMIEDGVPMPEIGARLKMEREEVERLATRAGVPLSDIINDHEYSNAWET